jgi:hypothetical protein
MSVKNPVTPPGIDPRTVRLVAQRLNHYATLGPINLMYGCEINIERNDSVGSNTASDVRGSNPGSILCRGSSFFYCVSSQNFVKYLQLRHYHFHIPSNLSSTDHPIILTQNAAEVTWHSTSNNGNAVHTITSSSPSPVPALRGRKRRCVNVVAHI